METLFGAHMKKDFYYIEKVEKHYTKRINGMQSLSCTEKLSRLYLPSLKYRRPRGDLIEVYKIIHNIYDPLTSRSLNTFDSSSCTPSNMFKLTKPSFLTKPDQYFFTNRIINNWNSLPNQVVLLFP